MIKKLKKKKHFVIHLSKNLAAKIKQSKKISISRNLLPAEIDIGDKIILDDIEGLPSLIKISKINKPLGLQKRFY